MSIAKVILLQHTVIQDTMFDANALAKKLWNYIMELFINLYILTVV